MHFQFTAEATAAQKAAMADALSTLPAKIPQIVALSCGVDAGLATGNLGFALRHPCRGSNPGLADESNLLLTRSGPNPDRRTAPFCRRG